MATSTPFYFTDTPFITVIHIYTKALSRTCLNRYKTLDFEIVVCSTIQQNNLRILINALQVWVFWRTKSEGCVRE